MYPSFPVAVTLAIQSYANQCSFSNQLELAEEQSSEHKVQSWVLFLLWLMWACEICTKHSKYNPTTFWLTSCVKTHLVLFLLPPIVTQSDTKSVIHLPKTPFKSKCKQGLCYPVYKILVLSNMLQCGSGNTQEHWSFILLAERKLNYLETGEKAWGYVVVPRVETGAKDLMSCSVKRTEALLQLSRLFNSC